MTEVKNDAEPVSTVVEDESVPKYTSIMAIHQAMHQKPVDFENTVKAMLADRIETAVEKKREEVAKSVFSGEEPEVEADDTDASEDGEEETGELESEVSSEDEPAEEQATEEEPVEVPAEEEKEEAPAEE